MRLKCPNRRSIIHSYVKSSVCLDEELMPELAELRECRPWHALRMRSAGRSGERWGENVIGGPETVWWRQPCCWSGTQRSLVDALCKTRQVVPQDTFKNFHKAHQIPFTKGIKHLSPDIYRKRHQTPFTRHIPQKTSNTFHMIYLAKDIKHLLHDIFSTTLGCQASFTKEHQISLTKRIKRTRNLSQNTSNTFHKTCHPLDS